MKNERGAARPDPSDPGRRRFIGGLAAAGGSMMLGGCNAGGESSSAGALGSLPDPANSDIDHIVVVMMENRSCDHGPGLKLAQPGLAEHQQGIDYLRGMAQRAGFALPF